MPIFFVNIRDLFAEIRENSPVTSFFRSVIKVMLSPPGRRDAAEERRENSAKLCAPAVKNSFSIIFMTLLVIFLQFDIVFDCSFQTIEFFYDER